MGEEPEEWWFQQERPFNHAELTAQMLESIQGYANMLWSMPWRIGRVPEHIKLYTSDNPLHGYLQPIREWWEHGSFATFWYYVPLSPSVLLRIAPFTYRPEEAEVGDPGARVALDFSAGTRPWLCMCRAGPRLNTSTVTGPTLREKKPAKPLRYSNSAS